MKVRETFYSMKCDCCGQMLDDENYYPENELGTIADECGYKHLGGRDYCPDCWTYDDDDNIECKDGRKYDEDGNRVDEKIFVEDLGERTQLQVKTILAIEKMKQWFNGLTDEEKVKFAEEYPEFVTIDKED